MSILLFVRIAQAAVTLPIEVMSFDTSVVIETATVNVPNAGGVDGLWMQIHGLGYPNPVNPLVKASVQVNNGSWDDLTNSNPRLQISDPGKSYGGIGGAFSTLKMTLALSPGAVTNGINTIHFRFNGTDGISAGYRVLKFNFRAGTVNQVPASEFSDDNPAAWQPPAGADKDAGKTLWETALLAESPLSSRQLPIKCTDCHTKDGRDLKYFNYSNKSIYVRSRFHGLSHQDGQNIAAYIRSLNSPAPAQARPWNPPYQPGPGIDSKPIEEWAAGAGIDQVLDNDLDTLNDIFPNGINAQTIGTTADTNVREVRLAMQFIDWNHWLPRMHPNDAWGVSTFAPILSKYNTLHSELASGNLSGFYGDLSPFSIQVKGIFVPSLQNNALWSASYSQKVYDVELWEMVKLWEMMNEFGLQDKAHNQLALPSTPANLLEPRGWFTSDVFDASPNILHIPLDNRSIDGSPLTQMYLSNFWYQLQLVLYSHRWNDGQRPQDWGYTSAAFQNLYSYSHYPEPVRAALYMIKAGQITDNGYGPENALLGWFPSRSFSIYNLVGWGTWGSSFYESLPTGTFQQLAQAMGEIWYAKTASYSYDRYTTSVRNAPVVLDRNELPGVDAFTPSGFSTQMWVMIPRFRKIGVSEPLLDQMITWAQGMWPRAAWDLLRAGVTFPEVILNLANPGPLQAGGSIELPVEIRNWPAGVPLHVEFYANDVKIGDGTPLDGEHYHMIWSPLPAGTYQVQARANVNGKFVGGSPMTFIIEGINSAPCDVNQDNSTNVLDVQQAVNQALGIVTPCTADINKDNQCNVIDVQRVVNAALGGSCVSP